MLMLMLIATLSSCSEPTAGPTASPSAPSETRAESEGPPPFTLATLRARHATRHRRAGSAADAPPPPAGVLERVHYPAPLGPNVAYVTPASRGDSLRPALIWMVGGFRWGIGASMWREGPRANDQSGAVFLVPDLVLMRPALRGWNGNPGEFECFVGEVDDLLAAADYLASRPDVDPSRIYLGGHSTGGTLALLVAESTDRFRAILALGAAPDARGYGEPRCIPPGETGIEAELRSPATFLHEIRTPTFVAEGERARWARDYPSMARRAGAAPVRFWTVPAADHFSLVRPASEAFLQSIRADVEGPEAFELTPRDIEVRLGRAGSQ